MSKLKKLTNPLRSAVTTINSSSLSLAKQSFDSTFSGKTNLNLHKPINSFLQSYAATSTLSDSISLLRHVIKTTPSFSPDRSTYHILLSQSTLLPEPNLSAVHKTLNLMSAAGFPPDNVSSDIAVRGLVSLGRLEHALQLFDEMSRKNSAPDNHTFNFLVKSLCKCRSLSDVYGFIERSRTSCSVKPDLVTYTILIDNVCNAKNLREMTRLVKVLEDEGFKPDRFVFNTIIKGYCMMNRATESIEVYRRMKESGVEPDVVTYNTLIFGLSKVGRAKEARKFLTLMEREGLLPDVVTYTSLMNGLCRERDTMGAFALLKEMRERGCEANSCTYNTLLHGFFKVRMVEKGLEFFRVMKGEGIGVESSSYSVAVRTLCRCGKVAEAYEVFDYAVESKSLSDVTAYATLESTLKSVNEARANSRGV